jgi:acetylornithine/succinyldiaminopimelate/putrescine aminotransferase
LLASNKVAAAFQPGDHSSTFGGNPLACATALTAVELLVESGILENAAKVGAYMYDRLAELAVKYDYVREVRGKGLMLGMELTIEGQGIVNICQEKGLLINCTNGTILRFIPPLTVTRNEVDKAVAILAEAMEIKAK